MTRGLLKALGVCLIVVAVLALAVGFAVKSYWHQCDLDTLADRAAASVDSTLWVRGGSIAMIEPELKQELRGALIDSVVFEPSSPAFLDWGAPHRNCVVVRLIAAPLMLEDGCRGSMVLGYRIDVYDAHGKSICTRRRLVLPSSDEWNKSSTQ